MQFNKTPRYPKPADLACSDLSYVTVLSRVEAFASKSPEVLDPEDMDSLVTEYLELLCHTPLDVKQYPLTSPIVHLKRILADRVFKDAANSIALSSGLESYSYLLALMGCPLDSTALQVRIDCDRLLDPSTRPYKAYRAITGSDPSAASKARIYKNLCSLAPEIATARSSKVKAEGTVKTRSSRKIKAMPARNSADPFLSRGVTFNGLALALGLTALLDESPLLRSQCLQAAGKYATGTLSRTQALNQEEARNAQTTIFDLMFYLGNIDRLSPFGEISLTAPRRIRILREAMDTVIKDLKLSDPLVLWVGNRDYKGIPSGGYWRILSKAEIEARMIADRREWTSIQHIRPENMTPAQEDLGVRVGSYREGREMNQALDNALALVWTLSVKYGKKIFA